MILQWRTIFDSGRFFPLFLSRRGCYQLDFINPGLILCWAKNKQYSFCLRIERTTIQILTRSTWKHRVLHNLCMKHKKKKVYDVLVDTELVLRKKLIFDQKRLNAFIHHETFPVYCTRKLPGWNLEKSKRRKYKSHIGFAQKSPNQMEKMYNNRSHFGSSHIGSKLKNGALLLRVSERIFWGVKCQTDGYRSSVARDLPLWNGTVAVDRTGHIVQTREKPTEEVRSHRIGSSKPARSLLNCSRASCASTNGSGRIGKRQQSRGQNAGGCFQENTRRRDFGLCRCTFRRLCRICRKSEE